MADNQNIDIQQAKETVSESTVMAAAARDGAAVGGATKKDPKKAQRFVAAGAKIVKDMSAQPGASVKK